MIFYLIRHGRQNSSDCNVDVPLSEAGRRQAELLGKRMKRYPVDALYSSDLVRAVETARIAFADRPDLLKEHQIIPDFKEFDFGDLTACPDAQVKDFYREYYEKNIQAFKAGEEGPSPASIRTAGYFVPPRDMAYPGGEDGGMVLERVLSALEQILATKKQHVAIVTHGGVIRVLLAALFGGDVRKRLLFGTSLENCGITQIHYDEEKRGFFLDRFNDYAHIEECEDLMRRNFS